jgi:hypothetical protein
MLQKTVDYCNSLNISAARKPSFSQLSRDIIATTEIVAGIETLFLVTGVAY